MSLIKQPKYPTVDYPTIDSGVIHGPIRCESLDGSEMYLEEDDVTVLNDFKPFVLNGKTWGVSHLQKRSKRGWLKVSPSCYHWWWFWKLQEKDSNGQWISGSERGIYFRQPFSWRWDVAGTVIDGILRHWIWTKGYLGGHWD